MTQSATARERGLARCASLTPAQPGPSRSAVSRAAWKRRGVEAGRFLLGCTSLRVPLRTPLPDPRSQQPISLPSGHVSARHAQSARVIIQSQSMLVSRRVVPSALDIENVSWGELPPACFANVQLNSSVLPSHVSSVHVVLASPCGGAAGRFQIAHPPQAFHPQGTNERLPQYLSSAACRDKARLKHGRLHLTVRSS